MRGAFSASDSDFVLKFLLYLVQRKDFQEKLKDTEERPVEPYMKTHTAKASLPSRLSSLPSSIKNLIW